MRYNWNIEKYLTFEFSTKEQRKHEQKCIKTFYLNLQKGFNFFISSWSVMSKELLKRFDEEILWVVYTRHLLIIVVLGELVKCSRRIGYRLGLIYVLLFF